MCTLQRCKCIRNFCLPAWTLPKIELQTHHESSPKYGHKCSWPAIASLHVTWHGVIKYMFSSFQIGYTQKQMWKVHLSDLSLFTILFYMSLDTKCNFLSTLFSDPALLFKWKPLWCCLWHEIPEDCSHVPM